MRYHHNTLYVEFKDFLAAGWKEDTIKKANLRNGSRWQVIKNPADLRSPMVRFDTLADEHKERLNAFFSPDAYTYMAKEPIRQMVIKDAKAEAFYMAFTYDGGKKLPEQHVFMYTTAASWLAMLNKANADKKHIKKVLNLSLDVFFTHVCDMIKAENIGLPATYQRLRARMAEFAEGGYASLISDKFGNKSAAKIGKTENGFDADLEQKQVAVIRRLASMHNNLDAVQVTTLAKTLFEKQGWQMIGPERMRQILTSMEHLTMPGKRGARQYANKLAMHVKRAAPTSPLYYWTLDGWTAELLFQTPESYTNRLTIVVVLDAFNKYPVGYAIGERENSDLIKQALRNAACHMHELLGDYYRPWQVQSDNYAVKTLTPYYEALGKLFTPAAVGNAKSKIIEPYFKYLNKTYCQTWYNWSGFNITARQENQPNTEFLNKIKKQLPQRADVVGQLEYIMQVEREKKQADFMAGWAATAASDRITMNTQQRLMTLGQTTGFTNAINGYGLTPTINGQLLAYDTFNPAFRQLQHLKWRPIFDPADLTQILAVSECGKHQFVLEQKMVMAMDIKSTTPEQRAYHKQITDFNSQRRNEIITTYSNDAAVVNELVRNTPLELSNHNEAVLKLMFTDRTGQQKEALQDAKGLKRIATQQAKQDAAEIQHHTDTWQAMQMAYLSQKVSTTDYE